MTYHQNCPEDFLRKPEEKEIHVDAVIGMSIKRRLFIGQFDHMITVTWLYMLVHSNREVQSNFFTRHQNFKCDLGCKLEHFIVNNNTGCQELGQCIIDPKNTFSLMQIFLGLK